MEEWRERNEHTQRGHANIDFEQRNYYDTKECIYIYTKYF